MSVDEDLKHVPGIKFVDHVAIAVKQGELDRQVEAYAMLGFHEVHREEVLGVDQVREALLRIGDGPNLIQLLEPLTADSPVQKLIERNGGRGGLGASRLPRGERAAGL
jgi:methylmalonyl-CoA/ethylmalonyl-CoA epimerase